METIQWVRPAQQKDASRLAEILIFAKRCAYRPIFQNDPVSFNEMQVLDLALSFRDREEERKNIYVYDDGIVRGMMKWTKEETPEGKCRVQLEQLYVEPFFQGMGIGKALMQECLNKARQEGAMEVWLYVLEKNEKARKFYEKSGFEWDKTRWPEAGTPEYLLRYQRKPEA